MASGNMQDIKRRIRSVNSTEHITNAMKLVSAAKLRRAKSTFEKVSDNFNYIIESMEDIFRSTGDVPEIYLKGNREIKNTCYIVVTSNRGLCGAFNSNVIKEAEALMKGKKDSSMIIAVGSKGRDYFAKRGYNIEAEYLEAPESITIKEARGISDSILKMYNEGQIDEIVIVYTSYINNLNQSVTSMRLLPFDIERDENAKDMEEEVEYEPSLEEVFDYIVPKYAEIILYGKVVESATCEHAARRVAMENATDNARDMLSKLSLFYNRARQAAITNEIIEVVSGSEAQQ